MLTWTWMRDSQSVVLTIRGVEIENVMAVCDKTNKQTNKRWYFNNQINDGFIYICVELGLRQPGWNIEGAQWLGTADFNYEASYVSVAK